MDESKTNVGYAHAERLDNHEALMRRIDRGVRVTFLLSVLAMPVSYLAQIVLARGSQDAVGIYGGILLWAGFVQSFFYLGGNAVLIKFLPEISPDRRFPFLISYSGMILGFTLLGVLLFTLVPYLSNTVLGHAMGNFLFALLLVIALVNIYQQIILSSLKACLELVKAQILTRVTTIGYLLAFSTFLIFAKPWFLKHLLILIAAVHIVVVLVPLLLGMYFLKRNLRPDWGSLRWHLPRGFWRFTLMTQISSVVNFFSSRFDQILVLIYASISGLGIYFVMAQLAAAIQLISGFFLESMLPALINILAQAGRDAARSAYYRGARLNQVIVTSTALMLLCFHSVILSTFGAQYPAHWQVLVVLVLFSGINSLGTLNAYLLTGTGKVDLVVICQALQVGTFVVLFQILGGKNSLLSLALAQGLAMTVGVLATVVATTRGLGMGLRVPREFWASLATLLGATAALLLTRGLSILECLLLFLASQTTFLVLAGYHWPEIRSILSLFRLRDMGQRSEQYENRIFIGDPIPPSVVPKIRGQEQ